MRVADTLRNPGDPAGPYIRRVRDSKNGLLLIYPLEESDTDGVPFVGFAVSFPAAEQRYACRVLCELHLLAGGVGELNLAEVWSHLEADTRIADVPGRVQRRLLPSGRRNVFLGLEIPSRNRMLILRVAANSASALPDVPDSRGLTVRVLLREAEDKEAEVVLALTDSQHRDIFDLLVRDLVAAAEQPEDEGEGLRRFISRLSDWQQLLRRLAPRGLPQEAQQGLWGELWALREVVVPVVGMNAAVNGWRGPMGSDQDFHLGATCIEVKTSTAASLDRLAISSERQLEVPDDVALLLLGLSLDGRVGHGETLPDLVGWLASADGCLHLLDHRLDLSAYLSDG